MTAVQDLQTAHAAYQAGELDKADAIVLKVLEDNPALAKAYQMQTLIALKRADIQTADRSAHLAVKHGPDDAEIQNTQGNVFKFTGRVSAAVAAYKKSLKILTKSYLFKTFIT